MHVPAPCITQIHENIYNCKIVNIIHTPIGDIKRKLSNITTWALVLGPEMHSHIYSFTISLSDFPLATPPPWFIFPDPKTWHVTLLFAWHPFHTFSNASLALTCCMEFLSLSPAVWRDFSSSHTFERWKQQRGHIHHWCLLKHSSNPSLFVKAAHLRLLPTFT